MSDTLDFNSPPPPLSKSGATTRWKVVIRALQARPGEWAAIPGVFARSTIANIRKRQVGGAAYDVPGDLDLRWQTVDERDGGGYRKVEIWARWVVRLDDQ